MAEYSNGECRNHHRRTPASGRAWILYINIFQDKYNGDWSICYIELYENYNCNNKEELNKKEGEIIRLFMNDINYNVINKCIAGRTRKEWCEDNENYLKEWCKEYRNNPDNKDKIKESHLKWRENNRDIIAETSKIFYKNNIEYYNNYREINKDIIKDKFKERYYNNRDDILEYKHFIIKGHWKSGSCPFQLQWPYLTIPNMLHEMVARHYVTKELK
jgi:hypothetical protein